METRQPAVSGLFYSAQPERLAYEVDQMLQDAKPGPNQTVRALVVPHAGYVYSGDIAASAFRCLTPESQYKFILLIGPSHHVAFQGLAVPSHNNFKTPLGRLPLDTKRIARWVDKGLVNYHDLAHQEEHCLEVTLPFLQRAEVEGPLIPVVVGRATPDQVSDLILPALNDPEALTIISTDMSHYHSYEQAKQIDENTHRRLMAGSYDIHGEEACGYMGLNGLQRALSLTGYRMHLLQQANSGDSAGDKQCVVGYAAYAIY